MAKKVLNNRHRESLQFLAAKLVKQSQDRAALDAAYEAAAEVVASIVEAKFPKADMEVLKRYNVGRVDRCIYVSPGYGGMQQFHFRDDDNRAPHVPDRWCNNRTPHLLTDEQAAIIDAWVTAEREYKASVDKRKGDFFALISVSRTFEDLVEVWPAAAQLREKICGANTALTTINDDVIARLKADPAASMMEAA